MRSLQKDETEYDPMCDPDNPRYIYYKDILRAAKAINKTIPPTPVMVIITQYSIHYLTQPTYILTIIIMD